MKQLCQNLSLLHPAVIFLSVQLPHLTLEVEATTPLKVQEEDVVVAFPEFEELLDREADVAPELKGTVIPEGDVAVGDA